MERKQVKTILIVYLDVDDVNGVFRERPKGPQHIYIMPKKGGDFLAE